MSRIGKKPIIIPPGVTCSVKDGVVVIKGPQGELTVKLPPKVKMDLAGPEINVTVSNPENSRQESFWGLGRTLLANGIAGVTGGFSKKLELNGVGYKAVLKGADLNLSLGFSHPVLVKARAGITFAVEANIITVSGIDKYQVGEAAARIRTLRPVEPYKGKGIKYVGEYVRRKAGKVAKSASA